MKKPSVQLVMKDRQGFLKNRPFPVPEDWGFIQRLDLETDGPVITAKTYRAQRILQERGRLLVDIGGWV